MSIFSCCCMDDENDEPLLIPPPTGSLSMTGLRTRRSQQDDVGDYSPPSSASAMIDRLRGRVGDGASSSYRRVVDDDEDDDSEDELGDTEDYEEDGGYSGRRSYDGDGYGSSDDDSSGGVSSSLSFGGALPYLPKGRVSSSSSSLYSSSRRQPHAPSEPPLSPASRPATSLSEIHSPSSLPSLLSPASVVLPGSDLQRLIASSLVAANVGSKTTADECVICMELFTADNPTALTLCECGVNKTLFHYGCLWEWMEKDRSCPSCRKELLFEERQLNESSRGGARGEGQLGEKGRQPDMAASVYHESPEEFSDEDEDGGLYFNGGGDGDGGGGDSSGEDDEHREKRQHSV